jgi:hypothetical protein
MSILLGCILSMGCNGNTDLDTDRFYSGELQQKDVTGLWVVVAADVSKLVGLGYKQYTNQEDHMLLLNGDGTCVYRTFDVYRPVTWGDEAEKALYCDFVGEEFVLQLKRKHLGLQEKELIDRSWYIWQNGSIPPLKGPYTNTNSLDIGSGVVSKNRWSVWRIVDSTREINEKYADIFGCKYRYKIEFTNPSKSYKSTSTFMLIGKSKVDNQFFLWRPVMDNTDGVPLSAAEMIRFSSGIRGRSLQATNEMTQ